MVRRSHVGLLVAAVALVAAACGTSTPSASPSKKQANSSATTTTPGRSTTTTMTTSPSSTTTTSPGTGVTTTTTRSTGGGSSATPTTKAPGRTTVVPTATSTTAAPVSGALIVFAASSLTEAFQDEQQTLIGKYPSLHLTYSFSGSGTLVTQIQAGAPADIIATADPVSMQQLQSAGLVETPQVFANNQLEIAVAPGNPKHITGLADLANPNLKVVIEDPSQPAGKYTAQALANLAIVVHPVSEPLDVKSTLATVTSGNADAAVVYVSDVVSAGSTVTGVRIPASQNITAVYPIAVLKSSKNQAADQAFVNEIVSGTGQQALKNAGFLPPTVTSSGL
jgi:molybdate transport system substrate-binding protein